MKGQDKNRSAKDYTKNLQSLLNKLLPAEDNYQLVVSPDMQAKKLQKLDETIPYESFYLVFNLQSNEFEHVKGVDKWLGYPNSDFTLKTYLNCIDPKQVVMHNMIAMSMYKTLCTGTFKLQFDRQRYISRIGLKHYSGEFIEFKKTTSIYQFDNKNRLLAQLNEFTKIGSYVTANLDGRITEEDGINQKERFERMVFGETVKSFMNKKYYSPKEFKILETYANSPGITSRELSSSLKIAPATVHVFNKRILSKSRNTFTREFITAREVALYLKREKFL